MVVDSGRTDATSLSHNDTPSLRYKMTADASTPLRRHDSPAYPRGERVERSPPELSVVRVRPFCDLPPHRLGSTKLAHVK